MDPSDDTGIDEAEEIKDYIKEGNVVAVNLEDIQRETAQRIVDFLSGVVHALDGDIGHVSSKVFVLAPKSVGITGDMIKDEIRAGGILASLRTSFR